MKNMLLHWQIDVKALRVLVMLWLAEHYVCVSGPKRRVSSLCAVVLPPPPHRGYSYPANEPHFFGRPPFPKFAESGRLNSLKRSADNFADLGVGGIACVWGAW